MLNLLNLKVYFSFTGINDSLPQTDYVKLIDVWMLFSMMFTFLGVILHTIAQVPGGHSYFYQE